ncbi:hypothetical protein ACLQ3C_08335 [Gordonia sp. DT30]|uniref:hypothetical protein n=1 Tax=Gordonia sp. DT30 TaxID=3416546 RepID=UPI003CEDF21A
MSDPHQSEPHTPEPHTPDPDPGRSWAAMRDWLADSVTGIPQGGVLDLGPGEHDESDPDAGDVPCAQILVLRDHTMMVRLSTTVMDVPMIGGYVVPRAMLDRWNYEDRFGDCTHGYLLTRSPGCVADICIAWFRDRRAITTPTMLGCSYATGDPRLLSPSRNVPSRNADGGDP